MSVTAMAMAWMRKTGSPATKCVLMALADHANDDGVCWPGQEAISRKTEMSVRSVRNHLEKLVEAGHVRVEERRRADGSKTSNLYVIDMMFGGALPAGSAGSPSANGGATQRQPVAGHEPSGTAEPSDSSLKGKKSILSPDQEPVGFGSWLSKHVDECERRGITRSVPRAGTSYRSELARTVAGLLGEGVTLEELELASVGVLADEFMRTGGHTKFENVLRKTKLGGKIDAGRAELRRRADDQYGRFDGKDPRAK